MLTLAAEPFILTIGFDSKDRSTCMLKVERLNQPVFSNIQGKIVPLAKTQATK